MRQEAAPREGGKLISGASVTRCPAGPPRGPGSLCGSAVAGPIPSCRGGTARPGGAAPAGEGHGVVSHGKFRAFPFFFFPPSLTVTGL